MTKIVDSTIVGNEAIWGGGLGVITSVDVTNTTISGNRASKSGGGIFVFINSSAVTRLANVTISDNLADSDHDNDGDGGGISNTTGEVRIFNSLIAGNGDGSHYLYVNGTDCYGPLTSDGYNLIGSLGSAGIGGDPVCEIFGATTGTTIGITAELGPLAANGGPTLTHALLPGSPAIDTGDPAGCVSYDGEPLPADQRNYLRPNRCDRGAFEFGAIAPGHIFADGFETGTTGRWSVVAH